VAAWSGDTLELTVENPTPWRVTELRVRLSRLDGDDLVQDASPIVLLPPATAVAPGVTDLLDRVAPDRKRPGLNPLDTGALEAKAGSCPEGFRWEIVSARGYAPR
jgi:P pilus assembly chaperone PapD